MRTTLLYMAISLIAPALYAQHNSELYLNGALFYTSSSSVVEVKGDVHAVSGTWMHNGYMRVQGNMYSGGSFQQRGSGTVRLENANVNTGERQFIEGSYVVRGGQSQIGVDDGSFYDLELANDQGIVYLVGSGHVADVRNSVNFQPAAGPVNRIVTHDIGMTGAITWPANGNAYTGTFGLMNPAPGLGNLINNTINTNGNMSTVDNGYIQGNFRRAIAPSSGTYEFPIGLEPAGPGAQKGVQYIKISPASGNSYDYLEGYFQTASNNTPSNTMFIECFFEIDYFGAPDHGEWMFKSANSTGDTFSVTVFPQDDNFTSHTVWIVTQDDTVKGTVDECGGSPVGLSKTGLSSFGANSSSYTEFGLAGGSTQNLLAIDEIQLNARIRPKSFLLEWIADEADRYAYFELQRSTDGVRYESIYVIDREGRHYQYDDGKVEAGTRYYYRVRGLQRGGHEKWSNNVDAILPTDYTLFTESVYPNPASESFNILLHSSEETRVQIRIFDISGKEIRSGSFRIYEGTSVVPIDTRNWSSGAYMIHITSKNYREVKKTIIQH